MNDQALADAPTGENVCPCPSEPQQKVDKERLQALGLNPGTMYQIIEIAPDKFTFVKISDGPVQRREIKSIAKQHAKF